MECDRRSLVTCLDTSYLRHVLLTEDRGLVLIVLEFKKVMEGIFQEKRGMLKARPRVTVSGLLKEA